MIMTDQDHDGSHIKGLIMNFLHTFYPTLLKMPGFLLEFITPIVKVGTLCQIDSVWRRGREAVHRHILTCCGMSTNGSSGYAPYYQLERIMDTHLPAGDA